LQYDVVAEILHMVGEARRRLPLMGYQEHEQTYERMYSITTRFLAMVNYVDSVALPIFSRYP
jgi:hypothetical protein